MKIKAIKALEILDSRGNPTVSATVILDNDIMGRSAVPSGASTGAYEAVELRDGDKSRYHGQGVLKAIANIEEKIAPALIAQDVTQQEAVDQIMIDLDGTANKSNLGANAILAVSMACARAAANAKQIPLYQYLSQFNPEFKEKYILPVPMMNLLNGGKHANWATDIQEYMILPVGASNFTEAIRMGVEVYHSLKQILKDESLAISVGDEGGFAPNFKNNEEPFQFLRTAIEKTNYILGKDFVLAIDAAATEFYQDNQYNLHKEEKLLSTEAMIDFYHSLSLNYPILSFEDPLAEDDWAGFQTFTAKMPNTQVVGDDLYVTNVDRLQRGIKEKSSNSILIKLNQIGTLTETIKAINLARTNNFTTIISHRSGETDDAFIADLAVAMGSGQIKTGAPGRGERTAKYNRLLEITQELGDRAEYAKFPFQA